MKDLALKVAHDEAISLVQRGIEEFDGDEAQVGVSLLLEAQFLLGEIIQEHLNNMESTPPLSLSTSEWVDDSRGFSLSSAECRVITTSAGSSAPN